VIGAKEADLYAFVENINGNVCLESRPKYLEFCAERF
jgi:hypothetical protein